MSGAQSLHDGHLNSTYRLPNLPNFNPSTAKADPSVLFDDGSKKCRRY